MTVTMDHNKNNRKSSWDSKMSVSTVCSTTRHYRRSPSSILSSDSDIRFTRKKLSSQYKCGCCIIACFLTLLLLAAAAVYVAYTFFAVEPPEEQVYRATFKVIDGDAFSSDLADPSTEDFKIRSRDYRERLNLLFRRSKITHGFAGTEVLALDGTEGKDLVVHFNIHIDPSYAEVEAKDLEDILSKEITSDESLFFRNLTIDSSTLEVKESHIIPLPTTPSSTTKMIIQEVTQTPPPPRRCSPLELSYCSALKYNITSYPNILGHRNVKEVEEDVISFRELVDAECSRLAYEFVCQVLQPSCKTGAKEDEMILPCRSFCRDFMAGCGSRLLPKFKGLLDCSRFPEFGEATCKTKPDCVQEMQSRALSPRICDGVVDCQDVSDEKSCTYCPSNQIHCGIGRVCIDAARRCDGNKDCPDGSDERACLSLAPSVANVTSSPIVTPHLQRYHSSGFVIFNEKGEVGKLCTENLNESLAENKTAEILHTVASSLCKTLSYERVLSVQVEKDEEKNIPYVKMRNPSEPEISFVRTDCDSKQVLKVSCSDLECGIQSTHSSSAGVQGLAKMAIHGDWPWHVALFKEDIHVCDGTLVSSDWLVTTASCFQGQPKAEWTARFGTVRLSSTSPWQQERRIVGMVKSPVEGSTIAMVKLEEPVVMNDFVRPACLSTERTGVLSDNMTQCNTLGWARNREQLQRVQVKVAEMDKCENISISTVNSLCTETVYGQNDCNEEEFAGTAMLCLAPDSLRWSIIGVSNWRIACSKAGVDRPRMYDKITSNIDWIKETISAIS